MRKSLLLLTFFACLGTAGWANANPTPDNGGDGVDPEPKSTYTFSINKAYLALFNLFSVKAQEPDTLQYRPKFMQELPDPENAPQ